MRAKQSTCKVLDVCIRIARVIKDLCTRNSGNQLLSTLRFILLYAHISNIYVDMSSSDAEHKRQIITTETPAQIKIIIIIVITSIVVNKNFRKYNNIIVSNMCTIIITIIILLLPLLLIILKINQITAILLIILFAITLTTLQTIQINVTKITHITIQQLIP